MKKSPEDAIAWGKQNYFPDNFHAAFGNTYFPCLSINDIAKTYANLSRDVAHQDVCFSPGGFDCTLEELLPNLRNPADFWRIPSKKAPHLQS